jgi:UDP-glucose 4-epimerase
MKTVIVTGAAGFIGSEIANHLASLGYVVYGIDNLAAGKQERLSSLVKFHKLDVTDYDALDEFFKHVTSSAQTEIYGVFHLAALPRVQYSIDYPRESHEVNVNGTVNVFLAAKNYNVRRVIYSASSSAYGDQKVLPFIEEMRPMPMSPYAAQKYFGETLAKSYYEVYGLDSISLRYFNVYGPNADPKGSYPQALITFVYQKSLWKPLTVTGDGSQTRDSVYITDVVGANIRALECKRPCKGITVNIGSGRNVSVLKMAEMIGGEIQFLPPRIEPKHTQADIRLAKLLLDWEPTIHLEDGIKRLKEKYNVD